MTEPTEWPHMLPCPFCGGDARHDAHTDDCYFILHRKLKNSGADMSPAFEVLAAWNRRTPQPTQAQANCWCEFCDLESNGPLRTRMSICPTCGDKRCPRAAHHDAACQKYPPPVATQAQAGAVPLTPFIPAQRERLFYNRPKNVSKGTTMADWHRVVQFIEAAHGIKGGQHGADQ